MKFSKTFSWPFLFLIFLISGVYWQFFLLGKIPIPSDLMTGVYLPWLDYKWGFGNGVPVYNPSISDIFSQFYPWKYLVIDQLKQGIFPLWNPYSFSGTPLLENYHTGALFPFNVLLLLPKHYGWGIYIYSQTLFAAIGMYLLLKHYVKTYIPRLTGAVVFSLSGLMTTWVEFGTGVWAASMLPWIFYSINCYTEKKQYRYLLATSIFYAALILAGHAQLTIYSSLLFGGYLLSRYFQKTISLNILLSITLFLTIGIGISSVQLYPAYKQVSQSIRPSENSYIKAQDNGLTPWYDYIRIYAADFFGNPSTYNYWGDVSYYENSPFIATLVLPLIFPLFLKRYRDKSYTFYLIVFLMSLFFALKNPLTSFIYNLDLPLLTYSSASRLFFVTSFSAGILSAISIEQISQKPYRKLVLRSTLLLLSSIIFVLIYMKLVHFNPTNLNISLKNSLLPIALLSTTAFLIFFNLKTRLLTIVFFVLICFDLSRYFIKFNPFVLPQLIFPDTPTTNFLQKQEGIFRIGRLNREIITPNTWIPYNLSSVEGYDPLALENYSRLFNRLNSNKSTDSVSRFSEMYNSDPKFVSALNVKYLLSKGESTVKNYNLKKVFQDRSTIIYQNNTALERFYYVPKLINASTPIEFDNIFNSSKFDPTKEAIVLNQPQLATNYNIGTINNPTSNASQIQFKTSSLSNGFIVIADTYAKGWHASVDGMPTTIYEVNGALKGIIVSSGNHHVRLHYWPASVQLGLIASIVSLVVLSTLTLIFTHNKRW